MKTKLLCLVGFVASASTLFSQENEIPATGNVGIGTTNPTEKLDVHGSVKVDSMLIVHDSMVIHGKTSLREDTSAERDFSVDGTTRLNGDVILTNGDVILEYLTGANKADGVLVVDSTGTVKMDQNILTTVYGVPEHVPCLTDLNGNLVPYAPVWKNAPGKLWTSSNCNPNVLVGIGTSNPLARLHIRLNEDDYNTPGFLVTQENGHKLLQVNNDGLVLAREMRLDLAAWPDYVFEESYNRMPLEELGAYISRNKHLPNVPDACQMEQNGLNVSETNVLLMEKVEELTLYLVELQQQLEEQQEQIESLKAAQTANK